LHRTEVCEYGYFRQAPVVSHTDARLPLGVMDIKKDSVYIDNTIFVVEVLPEGKRPTPGTGMPIRRNWVPKRDWKSIFYFPWR